MSTDKALRLAHELTMEYIKQHPGYLSDVEDNIPKMVDKIANVKQKFYDALIHHEVWNKLY